MSVATTIRSLAASHGDFLTFALLVHGDPPARIGASTGVDSKPAKKILETEMRYGRSGKPACWHVN